MKCRVVAKVVAIMTEMSCYKISLGNSGKHPWYHQTHAWEVMQSHPDMITVELREAKLSWELYLCPGKRICYSG